MMPIVWYILTLAVLLCLYALAKRKNMEYVQCVDTYDFDDIDKRDLKNLSFYDNWIVIRDDNGRELDRINHCRLTAYGDGLNKKDIFNGDQLLALKNDGLFSFEEGDILWFVDESGKDKIRVYDSLENNDIRFHSYRRNGDALYCVNDYSKIILKGKVLYKIK